MSELLRYQFDTGTADADPGTGKLRANNADQSVATFLYASKTTALGGDASAALLLLDDSSSTIKALLSLINRDDPAKRLLYNITGAVTSALGYVKIPVAIVSELDVADPLADDDNLDVSWARTGDVGSATGDTGPAGSQILTGAVPPDDGDGVDGDIYINTANGDLYQKASSTWGVALANLTGPIGEDGDPGNTGAQGDQGEDGDPGPAVGCLEFTFSTTTVVADPGDGQIRLNNVNQAAADRLVVDDSDANGNDVQQWLRTWNEGSSGLVWLQRKDAPHQGYIAKVTNLIEQTGYFEIEIVEQQELGPDNPLEDGDTVLVFFAHGGRPGQKAGGLDFTFSTTTTVADPGSGFVRLNNADQSAATAVLIDDETAEAADVQAWLRTFDDFGGGVLMIQDAENPGSLQLYRVTAVSEAAGYFNCTVVHLAEVGGAECLGDNASIQLSFFYGAILHTASRALVSDAGGIPTASAVTATELGHVAGVTSAIQTQLNAKAGAVTDSARIDLTLTAGTLTADIVTGSITNTYINASAAIAYSKLNLSASIVNADIAVGAAIAYSKLNLSASIVDGDISGGAAIQRSKIEGAQWNLLINANFRVWQDGTTRESTSAYPNNDDVYLADQWILLSDGNDVVDCSRESSVVPTEASFAIKLDVETANKKFGIFQPIEALETIPLRGKRISFSFEARSTGSSLANLRMAVVYWTGTADVITSDIVSAWNGAGSDPTLVASWAYLNTPSSLAALTTSYQRFTVGSMTVPTNATNIGVFIWLDDVTTTVGDFLYISKCLLMEGATASTYYGTPVELDDRRCMRFYEKTFSPDVAPADAVSSAVADLRGAFTTATVAVVYWNHKVVKRITPTVTLYNFRAGGAAGQWTNGSADITNARVIQNNVYGTPIDSTSTVVSASGQWFIGAKADARL